MTLRIASNALVVLAGPSGAGKSTWAARWFRESQVVASDRLRGVVGEHEADQRAGTDAFDVLDLIVERRLARGLLTVVDTLGMDADRHASWLDMAAAHGRPTVLLTWATPDRSCRSRNRARTSPVPSKVLSAQLQRWAEVRELLGAGFDQVHVIADPDGDPGDDEAAVVPPAFVATGAAAAEQHANPVSMRFGLSVSSFEWGDGVDLAERLGDIAVEAEAAGFSSLWVMDHFIQIPQVGREWEPMLDSWTTLAWLAARTHTIRLGPLVTGITYRNVAHLAKIAATLDVLSGGRAVCGLGLAWFEREHAAYGYRFPPTSERYALLEDALEMLPVFWGPGAPAWSGRHLSTPEALCYPRPVQERIPILVGGSGERRTLRLAARHGDACNLFGDADTVRHKVEVLHGHCEAEGRDPAEVSVTHLSTALCAPTARDLAARLDELSHGGISPEALAQRTNAATVEGQIGRFRLLADAGVDEAIVSLANVGTPGAVSDFAGVIQAFS